MAAPSDSVRLRLGARAFERLLRRAYGWAYGSIDLGLFRPQPRALSLRATRRAALKVALGWIQHLKQAQPIAATAH